MKLGISLVTSAAKTSFGGKPAAGVDKSLADYISEISVFHSQLAGGQAASVAFILI